MLVLVTGITGNVGKHLIDSLTARGHQVRGAARNYDKLDESLRKKLHDFVPLTTYWDVEALDRACSRADAVICAYNGAPEMLMDAQLLLLRAADRAGIKRFIAATWNYDWTKMEFGEHESYDPNILFSSHVKMTSDIKPTYIFSGVLAEVLFSVPGHGDFSPKNNGVWDPEKKSFEVWGTGNETWHWTTERDAADFAAAIVGRDDTPEGGFWSVCSGEHTLIELAKIYERVKGRKVIINQRGSTEELRARALDARSKASRKNFYEYIGWFYQLFTVDRKWVLGNLDNDKLDTKVTSAEAFLESNPSI
jgi:nucleoside-diphosphate-sugar epimerase